MGNACTKGSKTLDIDTQIFDKGWFSKCLQHDLLAAKYTNVRCVNVIDGCTVRFPCFFHSVELMHFQSDFSFVVVRLIVVVQSRCAAL